MRKFIFIVFILFVCALLGYAIYSEQRDYRFLINRLDTLSEETTGVVSLMADYKNPSLGSLALPAASQEATTTGWADDGSVVRLDTPTDIVGIGTTSPSQELGLVGSLSAQETSGTTTFSISSTGTGVGGCIQLRATNGTMVRIYATTTPVQGPTSLSGIRFEAGSCQ